MTKAEIEYTINEFNRLNYELDRARYELGQARRDLATARSALEVAQLLLADARQGLDIIANWDTFGEHGNLVQAARRWTAKHDAALTPATGEPTT